MAALELKPRGLQARWRNVYDYTRNLEHGTMVTYEKCSELLEADVFLNRGDIYRAMKEMETHDRKTLVCVTNEGYRVAYPSEHLALARKKRVSAYRSAKKAISKAKSAD